MLLNAYERVQNLWSRPDLRHRSEQCSLLNPTPLERIRNLGVMKMHWMFAHKSFLDYGIHVAPAPTTSP